MKALVERNEETGVELVSEVRTEPGNGEVVIYSVWELAPNGRRVGISGFDATDRNQAAAVFRNHVQSLKARSA